MTIKQWNGLTALFDTDSAWSPVGTPGTNDLANLAGSGTYTVNAFGSRTVGALLITNPFATLTVSGVLASFAGIDIQAGSIRAGPTGSLLAAGTLRNFGTISVTASQTLILGASSIINSGLIRVSGGTLLAPEIFTISQALRSVIGLSNTGRIALTNGGTLDITATALSWADLTAGTISVDPSSAIALSGTLGLGGATINFRPGSLLNRVQFRGETLTNGTVDGAGAVFNGTALSLNHITWTGSWVLPTGMSLWADSTSDFTSGTVTIASGARLLDTGTIDGVTIALGQAGASGTATLAGTIVASGANFVVGPTLGATTTVVANGNAVLGFARNFGTILVQSGSLLLSGNAHDPADFATYTPLQAINQGSIIVSGGMMRLDSYSDYQPGSPVATGQIIIGNGGMVEVDFSSTFTSTPTNANIIFADGSGTLVLGTAPGAQTSATIAVGGFTEGDRIVSVNGSGSRFDAASQTLTFFDPASSQARAVVTFAGEHRFLAEELLGLGGANINTSFVTASNILPLVAPGTRQWLGQTGNFGDANRWTPSGVPGAGDTASLGGTVAYVTTQAGANAVGALALNNAFATLVVSGSLTATGGLALQNGLLYLTGTLRNTVVSQTGGSLQANGSGTLDGVTWVGDLSASSGMTIRNGLTLYGANGTSAGRVIIASGTITISDYETIDLATVELGGALIAAAGLTIGMQAVVQTRYGTTQLLATGSLTNAGRILVSSGTLELGGSATTWFANTGSIRVSAGAELDLTVGTAGLAGLLAGLLDIDPTGTLVIAGTLDLGGAMLDFRSGSPLSGTVLRGATLANGTVESGNSYFSFTSLALRNIAWRGPLVLAASATLTTDATDRFLDTTGNLAGSIDLSAAGATLATSGLLDNVVIYLGNATTRAMVIGTNVLFPGGLVRLSPPSLGPGATVLADGLAGLALTGNQGTIVAQSGTLKLTGSAGSLKNAGIIKTSGGLLIAGGLNDYQEANPIPVGQIQISNGGTFKLIDASGLTSNHLNVHFIDNNGTFEIATHPATSSDTITVSGWVAGAVITADFADTAQFVAATNSLRFSSSAAPSELITVNLGTAHIYSANELIGLGTGTVNTDFVAGPLSNVFPPATRAAPQWLGASGSFGDANLWSPTGVPDGNATASLAGTVTYVVNQTGNQIVGGLVVANGQATLTIGGTVTATTLSLQAGTLNLAGTLRNATITVAGGAFLASGGTLDNVGWRGELVVAGSLTARNGLVLRADDGSLAGHATIQHGSLNFGDSETLDNAAITLGGMLSGAAELGLGSHTSLVAQGSATLIATTTLSTAGTVTVGVGNSLTIGTVTGFTAGTLVNSGIITVNAGTLVLQGSVRNTGTIAVSNGGEIDFADSSLANLTDAAIATDASSRVVISGTFDLGGGTVDFGPGSPLATALFNGVTLANGHIDARLGGFRGTVTALAGVEWRGPINVASGQTLLVDSTTRFVDMTNPSLPGTVSILGGGQVRANGTFDSLQINIGDQTNTAIATLWGGVAIFGALRDPVIGAGATIVANGNARILFARNLGTIIAQSGTLVLAGRNNGGNDFGSVIDTGATILASAYTNYIGSSAIPTGQITLANGSVFTAINPASAGQFGIASGVHARIVFADATGTVVVQANTISDPSLFPSIYSVPTTLAVAGFRAGDVISVSAGTAHFNIATNELMFFDDATGTATAVVNFESGPLFDPSELMGLGSTSVTTSFTGGGGITACFSAGTRIATPAGPLAVETLRVGDLVITSDGALAPIIWLGHRTLDCGRHPRPHDVRPFRVVAEAFGAAPSRDLWLSPDHAIFASGVLVPVRYLENGATIRQEEVDNVTYWHIELARHAVILAEGLPCETYLDTGNRHAFVEGGPLVQLHPEFARAVWSREACARLVTDGVGLHDIRVFLAARASEVGFSMTDDPDLHVSIAGARVDGVRVGDAWHFNIPAPGKAEIRSRHARPLDTDPASADGRPLGVAIADIWLNGRAVGFGAGPGWLPREEGWCWTNGRAAILVTDIGVLTIVVALAPRYWVQRVSATATSAQPASLYSTW